MKARVYVSFKPTILDPQGQTVLHGLESLGFNETTSLRIGKFFEMDLNASSREKAEARIREMCDKLLTNPVIEEYSFQLQELQK